MELPEDISSCHRLLVEQQSALDQIRSELLELMKLMDSQIRQIDALRRTKIWRCGTKSWNRSSIRTAAIRAVHPQQTGIREGLRYRVKQAAI